ncbi:hypothetical protein CH275_26695 [Rhodococcus sp. 06-235-1A]|uniref:hypothetical protein n=1 Tax=Rhodococcus sp. 06-235-1A TaxID=2022508 RepID=UPI000B9B8070|nr:hypothetical protein [Rhodococcus sp. 06-235-1A]OZC96131.1 hypothetical protein CH275_26695 [Rhodococcus sp. 06-235-1A]
MNTRKPYASVALSGVICLGIAALLIWYFYSGNDDPNNSAIQPQMPSLGTFLISVGAAISLILVAVVIWVEVITPWRVEREHRKGLNGSHETIDPTGGNR